MFKDLFITGTDTGVGKTVVSCALLSRLRQQGRLAQGMKPVASGCRDTEEGLRNEDAELLISHSSLELPYADVNPYAFSEAVAPHLVAEQAGVHIDLELIRRQYLEIASRCDHTIVEGVGGWMVPLNSTQTVADLAVMLDLPVVLVVGMRLGCLNHALLSYQAILDAGLTCAGWIANQIDVDMLLLDENIASIQQRINAPLLGKIPFSHDGNIDGIVQYLDI